MKVLGTIEVLIRGLDTYGIPIRNVFLKNDSVKSAPVLL